VGIPRIALEHALCLQEKEELNRKFIASRGETVKPLRQFSPESARARQREPSAKDQASMGGGPSFPAKCREWLSALATSLGLCMGLLILRSSPRSKRIHDQYQDRSQTTQNRGAGNLLYTNAIEEVQDLQKRSAVENGARPVCRQLRSCLGGGGRESFREKSEKAEVGVEGLEQHEKKKIPS